jgi:hypothetical protein
VTLRRQIKTPHHTMQLYESYSESNLWWTVKRSNGNFYIIYKKYVHTEATSQCIHCTCYIKEWVLVCMCQRSLPLVSSAMFWHLPYYCWSTVIATSFSGRSEIRAVRRVDRRLPVEMLQQYSSASTSCERPLSWRSTTSAQISQVRAAK